ncbi:hypothetical protein MMC13_005035 [Lambiella insularis]|nr:hypothetical protein [Lambiella insularis]
MLLHRFPPPFPLKLQWLDLISYPNSAQPTSSSIAAGGFILVSPASFTQIPLPASTIAVGGPGARAGSAGAVILNGQTLTPGQGPTTIDDFTVVLNSGSIFVNGQGAPIPTASASAPLSSINVSAPPIIAGQTVSILNASAIALGSQTIIEGQPATSVENILVSLGSFRLVLDSSTTFPVAVLRL